MPVLAYSISNKTIPMRKAHLKTAHSLLKI